MTTDTQTAAENALSSIGYEPVRAASWTCLHTGRGFAFSRKTGGRATFGHPSKEAVAYPDGRIFINNKQVL